MLKQERFFPAGTYTWSVPAGCESVDVFLVGGGGGAFQQIYQYKAGGGGGYTKTFKKDNTGVKQGDAISITPGTIINIIVGAGGYARNSGGYSQFMNSFYRANGGQAAYMTSTGVPEGDYHAGNGGSGGGSGHKGISSGNGGSDGSNGEGPRFGAGQGYTTRDFGEPNGKRNAGGGAGEYDRITGIGGVSDYTEGSGTAYLGNAGGGGYGGGAGAAGSYSGQDTRGGDGTVLIRYYAYE